MARAGSRRKERPRRTGPGRSRPVPIPAGPTLAELIPALPSLSLRSQLNGQGLLTGPRIERMGGLRRTMMAASNVIGFSASAKLILWHGLAGSRGSSMWKEGHTQELSSREMVSRERGAFSAAGGELEQGVCRARTCCRAPWQGHLTHLSAGTHLLVLSVTNLHHNYLRHQSSTPLCIRCKALFLFLFLFAILIHCFAEGWSPPCLE